MKKNAKRTVAFALVLVMLLALIIQTGCGNKPVETTKTPETTKAPATEAPETEAPATEAPVTEAPTTEAPATEAPVTEAPTTEAPETEAPATEAPTTEAPATEAPATEAPTTEAPETEAPATEAPVTESPETEAPETEPAPLVEYNITYDLDGGIDGGNPSVYNGGDELRLVRPIRPGYTFLGWTGMGISTPIPSVTLPKGTEGDLSFKANWEKNADEDYDGINREFWGVDDGIEPAESTPVSEAELRGSRGEGIHLVKTIYTDIEVDGVMDAAYTYGVRFTSDLVSDKMLYKKLENAGHKPAFDVYMIRGQDGKLYVYIDVTDNDVVVNDYLFRTLGKPHWCDCLHIYYGMGNDGKSHQYFEIVAAESGYDRTLPKGCRLVMTEKGYAVEFALDMTVNEMSIGVYLNETSNWNDSDKSYERLILKHSSVFNTADGAYKAPDPSIHDAVRLSIESASGRVNVSEPLEEKTGDILADIANRADTVAIIYDENATAQTILSAEKIKKYLDGKGSKAVVVREDKLADGESYGYYILMGMTEMEESQKLINLLDYNGYGVLVRQNVIAAVGWNEEAAYLARDIVFDMLKGGYAGLRTSDFGELYVASTSGIADADIPKLEGFDSVTDAGEGAYSIYKLKSSGEEFEAYCALLGEKGFELYNTHEIKKVRFATYYNEDTVVSVQFAGDSGPTPDTCDSSLRIVVEPMSNTALPPLEKPDDANASVTVSSVAMICPKDLGCSLCMVIQLSNGEFIIIDSGSNSQNKDLFDYLKENTTDGRPVVAAWLMTHFHQDHIGGFVEYSSLSRPFQSTTVKNIIYNFPAQQIYDNASYSSVDMSNIAKWPALMEKYRQTGTKIYQARTGQKYYFGNAEVEILWTYEDIMPFNVFYDRSNPTCVGYAITIEGQRIMITGDTSTEEFAVACKKYGDYLKSDFVQLSHHGQGDGGSPVEFYQLVDAKYVFSPGPANIIHAPEQWACDNAVAKGGEVYIRDDVGTVKLLLPYNGEGPTE